MNRFALAFAALVALMALPTASNASICGRAHGCARAHHHHHHVRVAPAPRVVHVAPVARAACCTARPRIDLHARFAKLRAERAATGAAFRASLATLFARVPRPAVVRTERSCSLFCRPARVVAAPAPAPVVAAAPRRDCSLFQRAARTERPRLLAGCRA